jgi:radical SAM superfamily enzyme YgiQ (UPF0313 family)
MRVLLISTNAEKAFGAVTPLGPGYVAAAARSAGHEVQILDLCFEEDIASAVQRQVAVSPPDLIGISLRNLNNGWYFAPVSYVPRLQATVEACRSCTDVPIVLGGAGFSLMPEAILRACDLKLGVVGEGEQAFPQLLNALENQSGLQSVPGLAWFEGNVYRQNAPAPIACLDTLDWPARDLFDPRYPLQREPRAFGNVQTKRGCRFHCLYCSYPLLEGRTVRLRSPKRVAEEMLRMEAESELTHIFFVDNVFNDPPEHALAICEAMLERKVRLRWGCHLRPDQVSPELVSAMARAGCRWVDLGVDAVSEPMLRALQKGFDLDAIHQCLSLLKTSGITVNCFIMIGGPGENRQTMEETLVNLEALDPQRVYLLPGIRIHPETPLANMLRGTWQEDSRLLDPAFCYLSPELGDSELSMLFEWTATHPNWNVPGGPATQEASQRPTARA